MLEPCGRVPGSPARLAENIGIGFIGCIALGMGFVLDADEGIDLMRADALNAQVVRRYLNGEDVNSRPDTSARRWVIDFYGLTIEQAQKYFAPFSRVAARVKPERARNSKKAYRERWWLFGENCPGMRRATSGLTEVLVLTRVSKTVMPVRVPTGQVLTDSLTIFATDTFADQAVLSSSLHQVWAIKYGTTMRTDPTYNPKTCFETFARPESTRRLTDVGKFLHEERREIMLRRDLGLTKLYNLVNDPDIADSADPDVAHLRRIHVEVDEAAMAAYGWDDCALDHGFHTYRQMCRWTISPRARVEILDRLLEENQRRASLGGEAPPLAGDSDPGPVDR